MNKVIKSSNHKEGTLLSIKYINNTYSEFGSTNIQFTYLCSWYWVYSVKREELVNKIIYYIGFYVELKVFSLKVHCRALNPPHILK